MNNKTDQSIARDVITAFSLRKNISVTKTLRQLFRGDYKTRVIVLEDIMRNLGTGSEGSRRWDSLHRIIRVLCDEIGVKPKMLRRPSSNRFEYREITLQPTLSNKIHPINYKRATNKGRSDNEMLVRIDVVFEALQYYSLIEKDKLTASRLFVAADDALKGGKFWVQLSNHDTERILSLDTKPLYDALANASQQSTC